MRQLIACLCGLLTMPLAATDKPNVIIFLADDLGWNDVGYHNPEISTPNIDTLARKGIELDRFYVNPTCSPTRASLMTGLFTTTHGLSTPVQWHSELGLPLEFKLLPAYFKEAGYATYMSGKWHLGHGKRAYYPHNRGFDSFYGFLSGGIGYYNHVFTGGIDWQRDGVTQDEEGYATELLANEAVRVIESRPEQPFFLYLAFNAPHTPIEGPGGQKPDHEGRKTYLEMVGSLDTAIGQVINALKTENILDETLLIFLSDNGAQSQASFLLEWLIPPARDGFGNNEPLKADKGRVFEGGIRVPAAVWWPGKLESDIKLEQPFSIADILPTLADIVGFDIPAMDGESQWPALQSLETKPRKPFLVSTFGSEAFIDWPWKLVKEVSLPFVPSFLKSETYYLYDLAKDPGETTNVAADNPRVFKTLYEQLRAMPRNTVNKLEMGKDWDSFGGEVTRAPWAESAR